MGGLCFRRNKKESRHQAVPEPFRSVMCCKGMNLFPYSCHKKIKKMLSIVFWGFICAFLSKYV